MPGFTNPNLEQAKVLNAQASSTFALGTESRATANTSVRDTVLFATVLFCVAIAQRFKVRGVRIGANALALRLVLYSLSTLVVLPRACVNRARCRRPRASRGSPARRPRPMRGP